MVGGGGVRGVGSRVLVGFCSATSIHPPLRLNIFECCIGPFVDRSLWALSAPVGTSC